MGRAADASATTRVGAAAAGLGTGHGAVALCGVRGLPAIASVSVIRDDGPAPLGGGLARRQLRGRGGDAGGPGGVLALVFVRWRFCNYLDVYY